MKNIHINRWFVIFISIHVFFWTLLPSIFRYNLPMDALEGALWGRHFSWGYDKNPFLNGWLTGLAVGDWCIYFFSAIAVAICFWAIFQLAKKILSPVHALISVLLLEAIGSYNIDAIDFDDNVLELSLWALVILFFYSAIKTQRKRDWILVGIFAGLSMMTKYYFVVLLLPMFLFLILNCEARKSFKQAGIYYASIIFILICLPHVIWLFSHDFVTLHYAFGRVNDGTIAWQNHFIYPWKFTVPYLEACLIPLWLFGVLYIGQKKEVISETTKISKDTWQFLGWMAFGPFVVTILLSLLFGFILNSGWGVPLLSLWGIVLLAATQPIITRAKFYRFMSVFFVLWIMAFVAYGVSMSRAGSTSSAHYPGKIIAARVTQLWHEKTHQKLFYVVGKRWEAGNIAYYSKDKPEVYMSADPEISFWIDENDLRHKGAVLVWDNDDQPSKDLVKQVSKRFPSLKDKRIETFYWIRGEHREPIHLGILFLSPK